MMYLAKKTVEGTTWSFITFGIGKLLLFISSVILARLLTPAEFGLAGLALVAISYLGFIRDMGVGRALIFQKGEINDIASTAFWITLTTGFLLFSLAMFTSPTIAAFFEQPELEALVQLLAFSFLFNALGSTHNALLQKELEFKKKLIPDLTRSFFKGLISIGLAWLGWGVWSLVWGQIIGSLSATISAWLVLSWRPSLSFNVKIAKDLSKYGYQMVINYLLILLGAEADYLVIGKLLNPVALGFYTVAFKIPELAVLSIVTVSSSVIFPIYTKLQDDREALRRGFLITLRFISLITFPIGIGLFVVAPQLITVVYSDKWSAATPVLQILALFAVIRTIGWDVENIYRATGRPDIVSKTSLLKVILLFPTLWWTVSRHDIIGAAYAQLFVAVIISSVNLLVIRRMLNIKFGAFLEAMKVAFFSTLIMFLSIELFIQVAPAMSDLLRLLTILVLGTGVYITTVWVIGRDTILLVQKLIGPVPAASR